MGKDVTQDPKHKHLISLPEATSYWGCTFLGVGRWQGASAVDALLLAPVLIGSCIIVPPVAEPLLEQGQVLGMHGVAGVSLGGAGHQGIKAAVTLAQVQGHDIGHEQDGEYQARLCTRTSHATEVYIASLTYIATLSYELHTINA